MKRVSKTAAGILAALILGVSSLGVSRVWADRVIDTRGAANTKVERMTQGRGVQQDIDTTERQDLQLDVRDSGAVEATDVRDLKLDGGTLLRQLPAVQAKAGVDAPVQNGARSNGTAVAQTAERRSFTARMVGGVSSFIKGERFDQATEKAGFKDALVPAQTNFRQEAVSATSLKPKSSAPAFNGRLAVDAALLSSTGVAAYTNVLTDHLPAIAALFGLGAFWVFFAGPANAWQIIATLPSLVSHVTGFAFSAVSAVTTMAGNVATALNHVPAIAYAYEWALNLYSIGAAHTASALTSVATFFSNLGTALMPNVHFVTSFPTVMSYAPEAAWGYGIAAIAAGGWYRASIMNTFEAVSDKAGYVLGGLAATVHIAIAPFMFVGKVLNEVVRPIIRPIWDNIIVPVWNFVRDEVITRIGKGLRAIVGAHVAAIAQMTVTAGLALLTGAIYYAGSYKAGVKAAFKEDRSTIAGLWFAFLSVAGLTAFTAAAAWGLYNAPAWIVRDFFLGSMVFLGGFGAVEGLVLGYKYGPTEAVKQARTHGLSLIKRAEQLLGKSWAYLTA